MPEIRTYGVIGLLILKNNGCKLDNEILRLIEQIRNEEDELNYCSGCSDWGFNGTTIKVAVDSYESYLNK